MSFIRWPEKKPGSAPDCVALPQLFCALDFLICKMVMIIKPDSDLLQGVNGFMITNTLE